MAKNVLKLLISLFLSFSAGAAGSISTSRSVDNWYADLNKPFFNPPNWVFGPVWSVLYFLIGVSLFLVWREGYNRTYVKPAIFVFLTQLVLNILWPSAFFALRSTLAGLIVITLLWTAIMYTIVFFAKVSRPASILLFPYMAWVSFAVILNCAIFFLNL